MRSKNALKALIAFFVYEIFIFVVNIIYPRWIILTYGSEINGLSSTITRVLSLVNLVQAGAVGAAIYQMYKPVAENDTVTQSEIMYSSKQFYKKITVIYTLVSLMVGGFYSIYLASSQLSSMEVFFAFAILTFNGALQLYVTSQCDIFFSAHQKKYFVTFSQLIYQVVNYSLLTVVLILRLPFFCIYVAMLTGGIVGAFLNFCFYRKYSKGIINKNPGNKHYIISGRKYLMLACIGTEAMTAAPTVIISTVLGLVYSSVFSVYSLIYMSMKTLISTIQLSVSPIFGNLVKTSEDAKLYRVYDLVEWITMMFGTLLSTVTAVLIIPFIELYTNGVEDAEYLYPVLAVFVIVYICLFTISSSYGYVSTVYGLFKQTCRITLTSAIIGIGISVICTIMWGISYVMIGLLFYQLTSLVLTNNVLRKNVRWYETKGLVRRVIFMFILTMSAFFMYYGIRWSIISWFEWFASACCVAIMAGVLILIYAVIFERNQVKTIFAYIKKLVH